MGKMVDKMTIAVDVFTSFFKILALKRLTFRIVLLNIMRSLAIVFFIPISLCLSFVLGVRNPFLSPKGSVAEERVSYTNYKHQEARHSLARNMA